MNHREPLMNESHINAIYYDLTKKQNAGNVHRIQRAMHKIRAAYDYYRRKPNDETYENMKKEIEEAKVLVW